MIERTVFTLSQAAKATGKSKGTISNALKKGRLSCTKENGEYRIDAAELSRVYPLDPCNDEQNEHGSTPLEPGLYPALQAKLDAAERLLQEREETIDDLRRRLDKADEERAALTRILTDQRQQQAEKSAKGGFWSRLIRSS